MGLLPESFYFYSQEQKPEIANFNAQSAYHEVEDYLRDVFSKEYCYAHLACPFPSDTKLSEIWITARDHGFYYHNSEHEKYEFHAERVAYLDGFEVGKIDRSHIEALIKRENKHSAFNRILIHNPYNLNTESGKAKGWFQGAQTYDTGVEYTPAKDTPEYPYFIEDRKFAEKLKSELPTSALDRMK